MNHIEKEWRDTLKIGSSVIVWGSFKYRRVTMIAKETPSQWIITDGRKFRKEDLFSEDRKGFGNKILVKPTRVRLSKINRDKERK